MGTNNFSFPANSKFDFDFAFVYTRDTTSVANYSIQHLYQRNKSDVQKVKHWFDSNQYPSCIEQTDNTCYAQFSISPDSVNSLNYFIFNSSSSGIQYTYLWDFGDGATSSIENPTHTYPGTGPYQLCLTVSDNLGCSSTYCDSLNAGRSGGGITINVVHTTGVNSIISKAANPIKIYPNPASSDLTIAYKPETKNAMVEIYNSIGQQVKQIALVDENQQITIADLTNGLYILKLNDGKNSATQRFVKQ
jgi:hypothetical protein